MSEPSEAGHGKPRVVFVHPAIQEYRRELFERLQERCRVRFLFTTMADHNLRLLPGTGLSDYRVYRDHSCLAYRHDVVPALAADVWRGDYDVWISSVLMSFPTHYCFPLVRARRRPFILWAEDWYWQGGLAGKLARPYARAIIRGAAALAVAGTRSRDFFISQGAHPRKVFVAPNATTVPPEPAPEERRRQRAALGLSEEFAFLFLNRLISLKGADVAIEAFGMLAREMPGCALIIAGDGPERPRLEELARRVAPGTRFMGQVPANEVSRYFSAADCYLSPGRWAHAEPRIKADSWGFTINEAMAHALPVISTPMVAAAVDLISDGQTGFLVEPDSPGALCRAMLALAANPARAKAMGKDGRAKLLAGFTPERQAEGFLRAMNYALREKA